MIEDPDGTQGWMLVTLLSDRRTAIVKAGRSARRPCRPDGQRAGPLSRRAGRRRPHRANASDGWCKIEFGKRDGYIRTADIWGVGEGEVVD